MPHPAFSACRDQAQKTVDAGRSRPPVNQRPQILTVSERTCRFLMPFQENLLSFLPQYLGDVRRMIEGLAPGNCSEIIIPQLQCYCLCL